MKLSYHTSPPSLQKGNKVMITVYLPFDEYGRKLIGQVLGEIRLTLAPGFVAVRASSDKHGHLRGADLHLHDEVIVSATHPEGVPAAQAVRITERR